MAATYNFQVLTPNREALNEQVTSIVAPGAAGHLGVLANHAPLITTLLEGELNVKFADNREAVYHIGGGVLKVSNNTAILLTESIESA